MALVFKITVLALVTLTAAAPPLSARDQRLAKITGASDLAGIQKVFQKLFQSSDIDQVLKKISTVTNQKDPVGFLEWTLQITAQKTLADAIKIFLSSTTQKITFIQYLEQAAKKFHHDVKDFFVQIVRETAKTTVQDTFEVLVQLLGLNDLFEMLRGVSKYTAHPDYIEIHESELKATGTKTLQEDFGLLMKITNSKNVIEYLHKINAATNQDSVDVILTVGTFKANTWAEKQSILQNYTKTSDFLSALRALPAATGESNALVALKKIASETSQ